MVEREAPCNELIRYLNNPLAIHPPNIPLNGYPIVPANNEDSWVLTSGKTAFAAAIASFTEAVLTGGNDNVVVPVVLWLCVKGLDI